MKHRSQRRPDPQHQVDLAALHTVLAKIKGNLGPEDFNTLTSAVDTLAFLTQELGAKGATIARLRHLIFGPSSENTSRVLSEAKPQDPDSQGGAAKDGEQGASPEKKAKPKIKGHGRNGTAAFRGANKVEVPHPSLKTGDLCPECSIGHQGKVYPLKKPAVLLRVVAMAPISATIYELGRVRCNLCGEVYVADPPPGVGNQTYDESAAAMIATMKYGAGMPFYRIAKLEGSLGIPLPASTQWDVVANAASLIEPAHQELIRQAAQGEVIHDDDTTMKILELDGDAMKGAEDEGEDAERTGIFTTGIVSTRQQHQIALFFTGRRYAGENLAEVLRLREAELPPPVLMCDGLLSRNMPKEFEVLLANCLVHGRRNFVTIVEDFPEETRYVIELLRDVYLVDAEAKDGNLGPAERLALHQAKSGPLMARLKKWLADQIDEKKVEPNSELGKAIHYMRKHWEPLTLFLREPGAPLDNNRCEQVLKKAVLHRKNALFYKTTNGARIGDIYMSLIHTAELAGANPFAYLVALQRNADLVAANPDQWMPWNYEAAEKAAAATG